MAFFLYRSLHPLRSCQKSWKLVSSIHFLLLLFPFDFVHSIPISCFSLDLWSFPPDLKFGLFSRRTAMVFALLLIFFFLLFSFLFFISGIFFVVDSHANVEPRWFCPLAAAFLIPVRSLLSLRPPRRGSWLKILIAPIFHISLFTCNDFSVLIRSDPRVPSSSTHTFLGPSMLVGMRWPPLPSFLDVWKNESWYTVAQIHWTAMG